MRRRPRPWPGRRPPRHAWALLCRVPGPLRPRESPERCDARLSFCLTVQAKVLQLRIHGVMGLLGTTQMRRIRKKAAARSQTASRPRRRRSGAPASAAGPERAGPPPSSQACPPCPLWGARVQRGLGEIALSPPDGKSGSDGCHRAVSEWVGASSPCPVTTPYPLQRLLSKPASLINQCGLATSLPPGIPVLPSRGGEPPRGNRRSGPHGLRALRGSLRPAFARCSSLCRVYGLVRPLIRTVSVGCVDALYSCARASNSDGARISANISTQHMRHGRWGFMLVP